MKYTLSSIVLLPHRLLVILEVIVAWEATSYTDGEIQRHTELEIKMIRFFSRNMMSSGLNKEGKIM